MKTRTKKKKSGRRHWDDDGDEDDDENKTYNLIYGNLNSLKDFRV